MPRFDNFKKIGSGGYSTIYETTEKYCLKPLEWISDPYECVASMALYGHSNHCPIVKISSPSDKNNKINKYALDITMKTMTSVESITWGPKVSLECRMSWACNICEAMSFMHSIGLVHNDIKLANILIDPQFISVSSSNVNEQARLIDYGSCRPVGRAVGDELVSFMPAEFEHRTVFDCSYQTDMFFLGVTLTQIFFSFATDVSGDQASPDNILEIILEDSRNLNTNQPSIVNTFGIVDFLMESKIVSECIGVSKINQIIEKIILPCIGPPENRPSAEALCISIKSFMTTQLKMRLPPSPAIDPVECFAPSVDSDDLSSSGVKMKLSGDEDIRAAIIERKAFVDMWTQRIHRQSRRTSVGYLMKSTTNTVILPFGSTSTTASLETSSPFRDVATIKGIGRR